MNIPTSKPAPLELAQQLMVKDPGGTLRQLLQHISESMRYIPAWMFARPLRNSRSTKLTKWQAAFNEIETAWRPAVAERGSVCTTPPQKRRSPSHELSLLMKEIQDCCDKMMADANPEKLTSLLANACNGSKKNDQRLFAFVSAVADSVANPTTDSNTAEVLHTILVYWQCCGLWTLARCRRSRPPNRNMRVGQLLKFVDCEIARRNLPPTLEMQVGTIWRAKRSLLSESCLLNSEERFQLAACAARSSSSERAGAILMAIRCDPCLMGDAIKTIYDTGLTMADVCRIFTHCTAGLALQLEIESLPWMLNALARAGTLSGVRRILRAPLGLMLLEQLQPHITDSTVAVEAFAAAAANGLTEAAARYFTAWPAEQDRMLAPLLARPTALPVLQPALQPSAHNSETLRDLVLRRLPLQRQLVKNEFMAAAVRGDMMHLEKMYSVFCTEHLLAVPIRNYHPAAFVEMVRRGYNCNDRSRLPTAVVLLSYYPDVFCEKYGADVAHEISWAIEHFAPAKSIPKIVAHVLSFGVAGINTLARHTVKITKNTVPIYEGFRLQPSDDLVQNILHRKLAIFVRSICCENCLVLVLAARHKKVRCLPPELYAWVVDEFIRPE